MKSHLLRTMVVIVAAVLLAGCGVHLPQSSQPHPQKKEPEYDQLITVLKPIDGVAVDVVYLGGVFYRVRVKNLQPSTISLLWDKSSYVSTSRQSIRLVRILDRNNLPPQFNFPQADSPIAPGSQLAADFVGESWMKLAQQGITPKPKDGFKKARIYLLFSIKGKQADWQGEVVFVPKTQKP